MAAYHEIPKPVKFKGTETEKWEQLFRYLWKLAEHMEHIINNIAGKVLEGEEKNG